MKEDSNTTLSQNHTGRRGEGEVELVSPSSISKSEMKPEVMRSGEVVDEAEQDGKEDQRSSQLSSSSSSRAPHHDLPKPLHNHPPTPNTSSSESETPDLPNPIPSPSPSPAKSLQLKPTTNPSLYLDTDTNHSLRHSHSAQHLFQSDHPHHHHHKSTLTSNSTNKMKRKEVKDVFGDDDNGNGNGGTITAGSALFGGFRSTFGLGSGLGTMTKGKATGGNGNGGGGVVGKHRPGLPSFQSSPGLSTIVMTNGNGHGMSGEEARGSVGGTGLTTSRSEPLDLGSVGSNDLDQERSRNANHHSNGNHTISTPESPQHIEDSRLGLRPPAAALSLPLPLSPGKSTTSSTSRSSSIFNLNHYTTRSSNNGSGNGTGIGMSMGMGLGIGMGRSKSPGPRSKEDMIGRVKAALFGYGGGGGIGGQGGRNHKQIEGEGAEPSMPPKQEVTQESRQISQSSGSNAMHGTGTVTAMMTGTWMISVGWEDKDQGKREKEQDKVDIYVNAPTHQDTLVRSLKDIMDLDSQLKQDPKLVLPPLPAVPPFNAFTASPQSTAEIISPPSAITDRSSSSLGASLNPQSPGKKSRQGSFLSVLSNKMRSTIRGGGTLGASPASPTKRPTLPARGTEDSLEIMETITTPPPNQGKRHTMHLLDVKGAGLGLGQFDFEGKQENKKEVEPGLGLLDSEGLLRTGSATSRPGAERSGTESTGFSESLGISFENATALMSAMASDSALANTASLPESSSNPTGIPATPLGAAASPSRNLSLSEFLFKDSAISEQKNVTTNHAEKHQLATGLSEYLSLLANDPAIRSHFAWQAFISPRTTDLTNRTERQERADWTAHADEILAKGSPMEGDAEYDDLAGDMTQRKKSIRRSRSLGSGILAGIFSPKEELPSDAVQNADSTTLTSPEKEAVADAAFAPKHCDSTLDHKATKSKTEPHDENPLVDAERSAGERQESALSHVVPAPPSNTNEQDTTSPGALGLTSPLTTFTTPEMSTASESETNPTSMDDTEFSPTPSEIKQRGRRGRRHVKVEDFELLKTLGRGCAGKVVLVKHKDTSALYAMKIIVKKHVIAHSELKHTLTEQSVLKKMAEDEEGLNPFIVHLYYSFFDRDNLYLILDFHPGGDLATQLSRWGRLGRDRARFYASEIVEGVEALHAAGVIYRDLKPENVLLGADGHIVLVDFGLAAWFPGSKGPTASVPHWMGGLAGEDDIGRPKLDRHATEPSMSPAKPLRDVALSFVGTAEYLAPEVIKGENYSYEVDWWSLGTMLYEALMGSTPFWAENHADMYTKVVHEQLTFPDTNYCDKDTRSFLRGLLQKDPAFRLCEPRIKKHPYLSMVDFDHVRHKRYIPPFIPPTDSSKDYDTQNFDKQFLELSPELGADAPEDPEAPLDDDKEGPKPDLIIDDALFRDYVYKDRQIMSVFLSEDEATLPPRLVGVVGNAEDGATPVATRPMEIEDEAVDDHEPPSDSNDDTTTSDGHEIGDDEMLTEHNGGDDDGERTLEPSTPSAVTPQMLQRIQSIASADHIKASNRRSRDFTTVGRASMEQLNKLTSPLSKADAGAAPPRMSEDADWDLVDDRPEENAQNGTDTFFGRGVVDRYKLAVLRRKESTIRRKQSSNLKRSPSSSMFFSGSNGGSSGGVFKSRLKLRAKSPKKQTHPPISRGAAIGQALAQTSPELGPAASTSGEVSTHSLTSLGRRVSQPENTSAKGGDNDLEGSDSRSTSMSLGKEVERERGDDERSAR